jgi:L-lactate dehydrogenase complex protein LldG
MKATARDRILSSIELALGFPPRDKDLLTQGDLTPAPNWQDPQEPPEHLRKELEALSARFHRVENLAEAQAAVLSILKEHSVERAVRWDHPLLDALGIDELLGEAGVQVNPTLPEHESFLRRSAQADIGITAADAVLMASGTVVLRALRGRERSTSLLPSVHLAVITPEQRLRSIVDLVPLLREWHTGDGRLPSAVQLISGPSRSADIELILTLGAHGPKAVHLLEVDPAWLQAGSDEVSSS